MAVTLDRLVKGYVELRDKKEALEARHKEELKPLKEGMTLLEAAMQKMLDEQGMKSVNVEGAGTAYKQKWTSAKVKDWEATLEWIREHDRWDLLTQAVNKTGVIDEMTVRDPETNEVTMVPCPVPGVEVDSGYKINVRRS